MTFIFQRTTLARVLLIFIYVNAAAAAAANMAISNNANDLSDITSGLTDAEIELALSGLTVAELNTLSKLVDTPNLAEYDYDDNSYSMHNMKEEKHKFEDAESAVAGMETPDGDEEGDESYAEELQSALTELEAENQRWKRENPKQPEHIPVDEEYIKQLEDSFPRDQEQSQQNPLEAKKEHVRVKRD